MLSGTHRPEAHNIKSGRSGRSGQFGGLRPNGGGNLVASVRLVRRYEAVLRTVGCGCGGVFALDLGSCVFANGLSGGVGYLMRKKDR